MLIGNKNKKYQYSIYEKNLRINSCNNNNNNNNKITNHMQFSKNKLNR